MAVAAEIPTSGASSSSYWGRVSSRYLANIKAYWREAISAVDFLRIMQVRLSQSKVGPLVCPRPITAKVRLRAFGPTPIYVRSHTTDISVLNEIVVSGGYDALLRHPVPNPCLIVDLGANTGLVDRWFLQQYPSARIVAVEPEPGNYACLTSNVADRPVKAIRAAIGSRERMILLHTSSGDHGFTMVGEPALGSPTVEVPVVTMASVLQTGETIDLLKVDIEGAEVELFADCADWIGQVRMLLVECHEPYKLQDLVKDINKGGATFRLLEADLKPGWGLEVGLFKNESGKSPS